MSTDTYRQRAAQALLMVYATLLLLLSLHVHSDQVYEGVQCYQCMHHLPHSGHVSAAQSAMHDCVLCQLQGALYVVGAVVLLVVPAVPSTALHACCGQPLLPGAKGHRCPRGPPAVGSHRFIL